MLVLTGILAALYHRQRTGEGQMLETSLLQAALSVQSHSYAQALEREEEGAIGIYPYRLFETEDDLIFIGAATDKFWRLLCETIGAPELGADPKYATNGRRVNHSAELTALLSPYFKTKTTAAWEELLVAKGVPCGPVNTHQDFFVHPQVEAMEMNPVVDHPTIGPVRVAGIPIHFEKTPGAIQGAAPTLGQHTTEILEEIGYGAEQIEVLQRNGVITSATRR